MNNISIDLGAKAILQTYHQVNDGAYTRRQNKTERSKVPPKIKTETLETELNDLQKKYSMLKSELNRKEELVAKLNCQLKDRTVHLEKLQEDFENALYQLAHKNSRELAG